MSQKLNPVTVQLRRITLCFRGVHYTLKGKKLIKIKQRLKKRSSLSLKLKFKRIRKPLDLDLVRGPDSNKETEIYWVKTREDSIFHKLGLWIRLKHLVGSVSSNLERRDCDRHGRGRDCKLAQQFEI